jgi:hypothetical protein
MSRESARLTASPLFIDVLSGEFSVSGNTPNKKHTLGRLAVATFQKGDISNAEIPEEFVGASYVLLYTPSWAPTVSSSVACIEDHNNSILVGLQLSKTLAGESRSTLIARDIPEPTGTKRRLEFAAPDDGLSFDTLLDLSTDLTDIRGKITQAALAFFL